MSRPSCARSFIPAYAINRATSATSCSEIGKRAGRSGSRSGQTARRGKRATQSRARSAPESSRRRAERCAQSSSTTFCFSMLEFGSRVHKQRYQPAEKGDEVTEERRTTTEEAKRVGDAIGVDWTRFDLEQFRAGMDVEFEHGSHDPQTDVTGDDPIITGKIALAHMKEFPDYYERLERMESRSEEHTSELQSLRHL